MNNIKKVMEEFENLKCVNYAMSLGCILEGERCDCRDSCKNAQTIQEAQTEYRGFIKTSQQNLLNAVVEEIESMPELSNEDIEIKINFANGYNQALKDVIKVIKGI